MISVKSQQGRTGEDLAVRYLQDQGLKMVTRNYRCRCGEVDLIMRDGPALVFVEVRLRRSSRYGTPAETVTARKQTRLIRTAQFYLQTTRSQDPCRFDVVAIGGNSGDIQWIQDAFAAF
ncbi:MAG: YraN family protein [Candidatus Competibacteraceae bacterium]|nr:YraN family protein [Candidatus Competibacteraceae bacterium]